jgi:hypothetical protein
LYSSAILNSCNCISPYIANESGYCVCLSFTDPVNYFLDGSSCNPCPTDCTCNILGCVYCANNTLRYILNISNYFVCRCYQDSVLVGYTCTRCFSNQYYYQGTCVNCIGCLTCN